MASACERRNVAQVSAVRSGAGSIPAALRISQTVDAATLIPSVSSSPWILLYPHVLFSRARRSTSARIDRTVGGRPGRLGREIGGVSFRDQVAVPAQDGLGAYEQPDVAQEVAGELV